MRANKIPDILAGFIESEYKKTLLNGEWGIGKTKYAIDFMKSYPENTFYISLYGKKNINDVINELYFKIIEISKLRFIKKWTKKLTNYLGKVDISVAGFSVSIPLISNLLISLQNALDEDAQYIIIIDDIERKHSDLHIKEIFGLVDSLSKIKNIKVVMIASVNNIIDKEKSDFQLYKEKAIDREYLIDNFAQSAPHDILGDKNWSPISKIIEDNKFKNLRIFEKLSLFINEVDNMLGSEVYRVKFPRDDIVKICFSVVFFIEEFNEEKTLIDNDDKYVNSNYVYDPEPVEYMCKYILRDSLSNEWSRLLFPYINSWYKNGEITTEKILETINFINTFEKKPHNLYLSEEEMIDIIKKMEIRIENLSKEDNFIEIIIGLDTALSWCDTLEYDFKYTNEKINDLLLNNINDYVNIEKTIDEHIFDNWVGAIESENLYELSIIIFRSIIRAYFKKMFLELNRVFENKMFYEVGPLETFQKEINNVFIDEIIKNEVLDNLRKNNFFFPLPKGKIDQDLWHWCKSIDTLNKCIGDKFYDEYINFLNEQIRSSQDKMLKYRLVGFIENRIL